VTKPRLLDLPHGHRTLVDEADLPVVASFTLYRGTNGYVYFSIAAESSVPWVIENVPGAPMRADFVLCGSMFGLGVRRHRWFECSFPVLPWVQSCDHSRRTLCVVGHGGGSGKGTKVNRWKVADGREAMGIEWMTRDELAQAIPPAYTEFIGTQLLDALKVAA